MTVADLRRYLVWSKTRVHQRLRDESLEIIQQAASLGKTAVSTSWGKDSVVLCDLAIEALGQGIDLVHLATPYELPGYDDVIAHFAARAHVITVPSSKTLAEYVEWLRDIGLDCERTKLRRAGVDVKRSRGEAAMSRYDVRLLGMRTEESKGRRMHVRFHGVTYRHADGHWSSNPLARWTVRDVWAHIMARGLQYNHRIYDAETHGLMREKIRNSGWLTIPGCEDTRVAWLRRHFPEQYRMLAEAFPQVQRMS
jgi:3'-phosphoadenosine 5'-phosphosulfate sulfotransferase (PAPS reductase)/FAD synthetase